MLYLTQKTSWGGPKMGDNALTFWVIVFAILIVIAAVYFAVALEPTPITIGQDEATR